MLNWAPVVGLAALLALSMPLDARRTEYWICIDAEGHKSAQDYPCPEPLLARDDLPAVQTESATSQAPQVRAISTPEMQEPNLYAPLVEVAVRGFAYVAITIIVVTGLLIALRIVFRRKQRMPPAGLLGSLLHELLLLASRKKAPKGRATSVVPPLRELAISTDRWSLEVIQALEWKRFEELCQGYWQAKGWRCEGTGPGADGGIDFNLYRKEAPEKRLGIIQCKAKSKRQTGVDIVRALYGVMSGVPDVKLGVLMCSGVISEDAKRFAAGKPIQLIDGKRLLALVLELPALDSEALRAHILRGDFRTPSCVRCEIKMSVRQDRGDYQCSQCGKTFGYVR